jgi:hypothetical protein
MSITFTPNGLSVNCFALRISSRTYSVVLPPQEIIPAPPALETAAASFASEIQAIPP